MSPIEVQENWLDNPNTRMNEAVANQSNEWHKFLINSDSSTCNAEIHSTDPAPAITISEATQRHDNFTNHHQWSQTVIKMIMMDVVKLRRYLQVSQILNYKNQISLKMLKR